MPVSDFLPFATAVGANVETQGQFAGDPALGPGYSAGQVYSAKVNKLWRQSSFVSAAVARMIMEQLGQDVIDNGDLSAFTSKLTQVIKTLGNGNGFGVPIYVGDAPPLNPFTGQLWFDTTTASMLYIYYDRYWIPAINQRGVPGPMGPQGTGADYPEQIVVTPTAGATVDVPSVTKVVLNPAATLATLILRMPVVADKRTIRIATRQRIDTLTISAIGGQTVDWAVGELPKNGVLDLTLVQSLNAWVRV